jgi:hypothetical protein
VFAAPWSGAFPTFPGLCTDTYPFEGEAFTYA